MAEKHAATFHGGCGAEHKCARGDNNPPHICTQEWGHFPATPHQGVTEFTWASPETPHTVVIP